MSAALGTLLVLLSAQTPAEPAPAVPGVETRPVPSPDEVDAILKELERESGAGVPAAPAPTEERPLSVPAWLDQVVPVAELRLRPTVELGHPVSQDRPVVLGELRGRLGAQVHLGQDVAVRLVLSGNQVYPAPRAPGPDLVHDAWVQWSYAALGGTFRLRAGRQEVVRSPLVAFAENDWELVTPRFDGLTLRWSLGPLFAELVGVAEAPTRWPSSAYPDVNAVVMAQGGVEQGAHRQVEVHALARLAGLPVYGDAGPAKEATALVDLGGTAAWDWRGLFGRAAVDVQQQRFSPPSIQAPAVAAHASGGYAPDFPWAQGVYAEAGARAAVGQPLTYLPGLKHFSGFAGIHSLEVDPLYGEHHGAQGEMDLVALRNMYDVYGRLGLRRGALTDLAVTLHRLALLDGRGEWLSAVGERPVLRAGESGPEPEIGYELDLTATAALSKHIGVGGSVGVLRSGPKAREAGFAAFAETARVTLDARW